MQIGSRPNYGNASIMRASTLFSPSGAQIAPSLQYGVEYVDLTRSFGHIFRSGGTALRVESDDLEALRDDLADAFHGLLALQDSGPWHPHVTIQNKVEPREARALQARLRAGFEPKPLAIAGLASWRYLGGPWEVIGRYKFRGARGRGASR